MNVVDAVILAIVGLFAVGGLRRGFLLGMVDLVAFGLSLVVAAHLTDWLAEPLAGFGLPPELATGSGFLIAAVVSMAVIGFAARVILSPLAALGAGTPLGWANGVLGLLPGAVRGVAIAAILVLAVSALPPQVGLRTPLEESRLAAPFARTGREALDAVLVWAGLDPRALGIPYEPAAPGAGDPSLPGSVLT